VQRVHAVFQRQLDFRLRLADPGKDTLLDVGARGEGPADLAAAYKSNPAPRPESSRKTARFELALVA
jgi:hypothetical protein